MESNQLVSKVIPVVPCVMCGGRGEEDPTNKLPKKRQTKTCEYCRGERFVPLVTCRGCGRPALRYDGPISYCGRDKCWEILVEEIDPEKDYNSHTGFSVMDKRHDWTGRGYVPQNEIEASARRLGFTVEEYTRWMSGMERDY